MNNAGVFGQNHVINPGFVVVSVPEPGSQASGLDLLFRTVTLTVSEITRVERKSIDVVVLECDTW